MIATVSRIVAELVQRANGNIIRISGEYIEGGTNFRIHHFLTECIAPPFTRVHFRLNSSEESFGYVFH